MIVLVFNVKAKGSTSDLVAPKTGKLTCKLFSALDCQIFMYIHIWTDKHVNKYEVTVFT